MVSVRRDPRPRAAHYTKRIFFSIVKQSWVLLLLLLKDILNIDFRQEDLRSEELRRERELGRLESAEFSFIGTVGMAAQTPRQETR